MRIHVINPNTTSSMTAKIASAANAAATPGVEIRATNPAFGPPSIEGYFDEAFSIPGLLAEMTKAPDSDAFVIACFDDTGLDAARCVSAVPVVGIGEGRSAWRASSRIGSPLSRPLPAR
jgi:allantoin racemase